MVSLDIISEYDGLLLVHPDWFTHPSVSSKGIETVYDNFKSAQQYCSDKSIPFMVALAFTKYTMPDSSFDDFSLTECHKIDKQNIVGHVSEIVDKKPEDISLLFGGFKFGDCVRNWVANLCKDIEYTAEDQGPVSEWINNNQFWQKPERFKKGRILYELTDRILE